MAQRKVLSTRIFLCDGHKIRPQETQTVPLDHGRGDKQTINLKVTMGLPLKYSDQPSPCPDLSPGRTLKKTMNDRPSLSSLSM